MRQLLLIIISTIIFLACKNNKPEIDPNSLECEELKSLIIKNINLLNDNIVDNRDSIYTKRKTQLKNDFKRLFDKLDSLSQNNRIDSLKLFRKNHLSTKSPSDTSLVDQSKMDLCLIALEAINKINDEFMYGRVIIKNLRPIVNQKDDSIYVSISAEDFTDHNLAFAMFDFDTITKEYNNYDYTTVKYFVQNGVLKFKKNDVTRPKSAVVKIKKGDIFDNWPIEIK